MRANKPPHELDALPIGQSPVEVERRLVQPARFLHLLPKTESESGGSEHVEVPRRWMVAVDVPWRDPVPARRCGALGQVEAIVGEGDAEIAENQSPFARRKMLPGLMSRWMYGPTTSSSAPQYLLCREVRGGNVVPAERGPTARAPARVVEGYPYYFNFRVWQYEGGQADVSDCLYRYRLCGDAGSVEVQQGDRDVRLSRDLDSDYQGRLDSTTLGEPIRFVWSGNRAECAGEGCNAELWIERLRRGTTSSRVADVISSGRATSRSRSARSRARSLLGPDPHDHVLAVGRPDQRLGRLERAVVGRMVEVRPLAMLQRRHAVLQRERGPARVQVARRVAGLRARIHRLDLAADPLEVDERVRAAGARTLAGLEHQEVRIVEEVVHRDREVLRVARIARLDLRPRIAARHRRPLLVILPVRRHLVRPDHLHPVAAVILPAAVVTAARSNKERDRKDRGAAI